MISDTCDHFSNPIGGISQVYDSQESFSLLFIYLGNMFQIENNPSHFLCK